jgi:predicted trehalose synthase
VVAEEAAEPVAVEEAAESTARHADALSSADSAVAGLTEDAKDVGADTVTAALATLADERDSGAITEEEFEARKQDLLDRL